MIHRFSIDSLKQIFLTLPVPICLLDRNTRYLAANKKYAELCNTTLDKLAGRSMEDFCPSDLVAKARRDFEILDDGGSIPDHEIIYKNRPLLVSVSPFDQGCKEAVSAIAVTLTDISKLKMEFTTVSDSLTAAYKHMEGIAETDALTGLANRHGLHQFFEQETRRLVRKQRPTSLAIIDVDYFKSYNDQYGHLAGDECLKAVSSAIQSTLRRSQDCVARYGGEEFVIVLPATDLAGSQQVAQTILQTIRDLGIEHKGSPFERITASIGVVGVKTIPRGLYSADVWDSLLRSADKALYAAKNAGRNCVRAWRAKSE